MSNSAKLVDPHRQREDQPAGQHARDGAAQPERQRGQRVAAARSGAGRGSRDDHLGQHQQDEAGHGVIDGSWAASMRYCLHQCQWRFQPAHICLDDAEQRDRAEQPFAGIDRRALDRCAQLQRRHQPAHRDLRAVPLEHRDRAAPATSAAPPSPDTSARPPSNPASASSAKRRASSSLAIRLSPSLSSRATPASARIAGQRCRRTGPSSRLLAPHLIEQRPQIGRDRIPRPQPLRSDRRRSSPIRARASAHRFADRVPDRQKASTGPSAASITSTIASTCGRENPAWLTGMAR